MSPTLRHGLVSTTCLGVISSCSRLPVSRLSASLSQQSLRHLNNASTASTASKRMNGQGAVIRSLGQPKGTVKASMSAHMGLREYASQHGLATANQDAHVHHAYEPITGTWQYIVADASTKNAVIIDPVLDYDAATATITTKTADSLLATVKENGYNVQMLLETHAHADHITAANYLKAKLGELQATPPLIGIGKRIVQVQEFWARRFNVAEGEYRGVFDKLLDDNESFSIGSINATAVHLPGHTPDHMGYLIAGTFFRAVL